MSNREFNERARNASDPWHEDNLNANQEIFDDMLSDLYDESYAAELQKNDPDAYRQQLKRFNDEHSI